MTTTLLFANNATSTLAASISSTATTCTLATGTGSKFPSPTTGQGFLLTFNDAATGLLNEIVLVTGISGDTITTMVRAQENTMAQNWSKGDSASNFITAGTNQAFAQATALGSLATATVPIPSVSNTYLQWNGTAYAWEAAGGGSSGITTYALTFDNLGLGAVSGASFDGSAAIDISYNSIGAVPLNGTGATGVWPISVTGNAATVTTITALQIDNALGFTPYSAANPANYLTTINGTQVTAALGFTPYDASNPAGYLSAITSAEIVSALGYTPYSAANPNNYISNITGSQVTTALGYTPAKVDGTNATGSWPINITGNANYASTAGSATTATSATNATNAVNANHATTADTAINAGHATTADSALTATNATNVLGGATNKLLVQTGSGATGFVPAPTASGQILKYAAGSFGWALPNGTVDLANPGYVVFDNGLIAQWGLCPTSSVSAGGAATQAISFPIAFPNACLNVQISLTAEFLGQKDPGSVSTMSGDLSVNGFSCGYGNSSNQTQQLQSFYLAIGF